MSEATFSPPILSLVSLVEQLYSVLFSMFKTNLNTQWHVCKEDILKTIQDFRIALWHVTETVQYVYVSVSHYFLTLSFIVYIFRSYIFKYSFSVFKNHL